MYSWRVHQAQLVVGRRRGWDHGDVRPVEDTKRARQPHRQVDADRGEWMSEAEVVTREFVVEDDSRPAGHSLDSSPRSACRPWIAMIRATWTTE